MYILNFPLNSICSVATWVLILLILQTLYLAVRDAIATTRTLHQIPCSDCQFFTENYYLKCTVHPTYALTKAAINCRDFCPRQKPLRY